MKTASSISICVPTRNRAASLRHTLEAMRAQTSSYTELIVGDDASDDNTQEVVESLRDPRIRYLRHPINVGIYSNWNTLIGLCTGDYICIYHDHDEYLPTILEYSRKLLDLHEEMSFVHTACRLIDGDSNLAGVDIRPFPAVMAGTALRIQLAQGWSSPIMAATAMVRRTAYQEAGPYNPGRYGLGCDKHMWFRLAGMGTVGYISEPQANIRTRQRGVSTAKFNWQHVYGLMQMRQEQISESYRNDQSGRLHAERRMELERDRLLLPLCLRALLLDPPEEWAKEERRVTEALRPASLLLYRATRASRLVRRLLRLTVLPCFYRANEFRAKMAKRRAESCAPRSAVVPS